MWEGPEGGEVCGFFGWRDWMRLACCSLAVMLFVDDGETTPGSFWAEIGGGFTERAGRVAWRMSRSEEICYERDESNEYRDGVRKMA